MWAGLVHGQFDVFGVVEPHVSYAILPVQQIICCLQLRLSASEGVCFDVIHRYAVVHQ